MCSFMSGIKQTMKKKRTPSKAERMRRSGALDQMWASSRNKASGQQGAALLEHDDLQLAARNRAIGKALKVKGLNVLSDSVDYSLVCYYRMHGAADSQTTARAFATVGAPAILHRKVIHWKPHPRWIIYETQSDLDDSITRVYTLYAPDRAVSLRVTIEAQWTETLTLEKAARGLFTVGIDPSSASFSFDRSVQAVSAFGPGRRRLIQDLRNALNGRLSVAYLAGTYTSARMARTQRLMWVYRYALLCKRHSSLGRYKNSDESRYVQWILTTPHESMKLIDAYWPELACDIKVNRAEARPLMKELSPRMVRLSSLHGDSSAPELDAWMDEALHSGVIDALCNVSIDTGWDDTDTDWSTGRAKDVSFPSVVGVHQSRAILASLVDARLRVEVGLRVDRAWIGARNRESRADISIDDVELMNRSARGLFVYLLLLERVITAKAGKEHPLRDPAIVNNVRALIISVDVAINAFDSFYDTRCPSWRDRLPYEPGTSGGGVGKRERKPQLFELFELEWALIGLHWNRILYNIALSLGAITKWRDPPRHGTTGDLPIFTGVPLARANTLLHILLPKYLHNVFRVFTNSAMWYHAINDATKRRYYENIPESGRLAIDSNGHSVDFMADYMLHFLIYRAPTAEDYGAGAAVTMWCVLPELPSPHVGESLIKLPILEWSPNPLTVLHATELRSRRSERPRLGVTRFQPTVRIYNTSGPAEELWLTCGATYELISQRTHIHQPHARAVFEPYPVDVYELRYIEPEVPNNLDLPIRVEPETKAVAIIHPRYQRGEFALLEFYDNDPETDDPAYHSEVQRSYEQYPNTVRFREWALVSRPSRYPAGPSTASAPVAGPSASGDSKPSIAPRIGELSIGERERLAWMQRRVALAAAAGGI